jgi:ubiquinol-cytochrome c reductase cytochrome c subunit
MRFIVVVLSLAPAVALFAQGNADNGKKLWSKTGCYQCHGLEAQGTNAGPRLAQKSLTAAGLIAYVRKPLPGSMPPYSEKVISDAELTDIWTYVKSVPAPPANIPILADK